MQQIQGGAPADVFASADGANMQKLVTGGQVTAEPTVFAAERADDRGEEGQPEEREVAGRPRRPRRRVALCATRCRAASTRQQALAGAGVTIPPEKITKGADVKATLAAVSTGDADAAIVYTTDAKAAGTTVAGGEDPRVAQRDRDLPDRADRSVEEPRTSRRRGSSTQRHPRARRHCESFGFLPPPLQ